MISEHLPALQVVLPLMSAPLIVVVRREPFAWALATIVSWIGLAIAVELAVRTAQSGVISYAIGNWPPPWGIEYRVDRLNAFVLVLVSLVGAIIMPYARTSVAAELPSERRYLFYSMYCLCLAGLLGITITGDVFNLFVFLEISSLSAYVLIALGQRRRALFAAFQYLVLGTIGATFYVTGIGLLYLMTGTLNLADLAVRVAAVHELRPVLAALAFITVGIGMKLALFPLHQWLPNAYAYAPSVVTAFLAATATKVALYVLMRFYYVVFGSALVFQTLPLGEILLALSVVAIVSMSLVAVFQSDLKRMLAYSSVAQIGYITLGISLTNTAGLTGAIAHLFNHGVTKGALFLLAGGVSLRCGGTSFAAIAGPRPADADHVARDRYRRSEPDRDPGDGGIHDQMVSRRWSAGARLLVARGRHRRELAHRGRLRLALRRSGVLAGTRTGSTAPWRDAARHAAADVVDGGRLHLFRAADVVQHRLREQRGGALAS